MSVLPPLRHWDNVASKLNVVCEAKEANHSSETVISSLSCAGPNQASLVLPSHILSAFQLEGKKSHAHGTKKILLDEDIADELKKLVTYGPSESNSEF